MLKHLTDSVVDRLDDIDFLRALRYFRKSIDFGYK